MKKIFILFVFIIALAGCKKQNQIIGPYQPGVELVGSWVGIGTNYAGSREIIGSTTFVFNPDMTFVALDNAHGMPTLTEGGVWFVNKDTLKLKFKREKKSRPNIIAYEERVGGSKDIMKPIPDDSDRVITWNYRVSGNKLVLGSDSTIYSGANQFIKD